MKWTAFRIDQLGTISRGRSRHRPRDASHLYGGPYPFIQTGDVKRAGLYLTEYTQTLSEAGLEQSRMWPEGTLCITIAANIADTSILTFPACFPDSVIGFTPNHRICDVRFVKYMFDSSVKFRLRQFSQGAAQDNLSQEKLLCLELMIPDLPTQQRIAEILSAYDDLIENNQRRMKLLEESARLLYQEWFVRLRFPGYEHTRVVDGVPEGWKWKKLGEIADVNSTSLKSNFDGHIDYIDIGSVTPGSINETTPYEFKDAPGRARRIVRHGDVIWSCVRPNRRSFALVWNPNEGLIASTGFAVLTPKATPSSFLYYATTTDSFVGFLEKAAKGGAYPAVVSGDFERAEILVPQKTVMTPFHEHIEPIFHQRHALDLGNRKLRAARDLLLPLLMNGQIEV